MTAKRIYQNNKLYLWRLNIPIKSGSIKVHLIFQDDMEKPHSHPWDFKSFLILPYKEELGEIVSIQGFTEAGKHIYGYEAKLIYHKVFATVKREHKLFHRVKLYSIFGFKIPAITIGKYSHKKELCSLCKSLGYCKTERK